MITDQEKIIILEKLKNENIDLSKIELKEFNDNVILIYLKDNEFMGSLDFNDLKNITYILSEIYLKNTNELLAESDLKNQLDLLNKKAKKVIINKVITSNLQSAFLKDLINESWQWDDFEIISEFLKKCDPEINNEYIYPDKIITKLFNIDDLLKIKLDNNYFKNQLEQFIDNCNFYLLHKDDEIKGRFIDYCKSDLGVKMNKARPNYHKVFEIFKEYYITLKKNETLSKIKFNNSVLKAKKIIESFYKLKNSTNFKTINIILKNGDKLKIESLRFARYESEKNKKTMLSACLKYDRIVFNPDDVKEFTYKNKVLVTI